VALGGAGRRPGVFAVDEVLDAGVAGRSDLPFELELEVGKLFNGADVLEDGFGDEGFQAAVSDGPAVGELAAGDGAPALGGMAIEERAGSGRAEGHRGREQGPAGNHLHRSTTG
jgi:hypothetical protein